MSSEQKDGCISPSHLCTSISFVALPALARASSAMLKRSGQGDALAFFFIYWEILVFRLLYLK
jgi:hypothetical protein